MSSHLIFITTQTQGKLDICQGQISGESLHNSAHTLESDQSGSRMTLPLI